MGAFTMRSARDALRTRALVRVYDVRVMRISSDLVERDVNAAIARIVEAFA